MRNIFLLLVLLNLLVFIYQRWILEPSRLADKRTEQTIPMLQLAGPAGVEARAEEPVAGDAPDPRCLRLGPFPSRSDALDVRAALRKRGAEVSQTTDEGEVWVGHWVQVTDQGSRAKAEAARRELTANDLDTYILPDDASYALSLGIYRKRASAEEVQKKARSLGYKTIMTDRFEPGSVFWLKVRLPVGGTLRAGEFQGDSGQILRTEIIPCAAE
jgi:cell division septation protein DedD